MTTYIMPIEEIAFFYYFLKLDYTSPNVSHSNENKSRRD